MANTAKVKKWKSKAREYAERAEAAAERAEAAAARLDTQHVADRADAAALDGNSEVTGGSGDDQAKQRSSARTALKGLLRGRSRRRDQSGGGEPVDSAH